MGRWTAVIALLCAVACAPDRVVGAEPWMRAPDIRIALFAQGEQLSVQALEGPSKLEFDLSGPEDDVEIWLFAYREDTLRAAFPGFAFATRAQIVAALTPVLGKQGEAPPPSDEVLSAVLEDGMSYRTRTWAEWSERSRAGLAFSLQLADADVCGEATVTTMRGPVGVSLDGMAPVSADHVLFTGRRANEVSVQLHALKNGAITPLAARAEKATVYSRPSWDRTTQSAWDVDQTGQMYRFDVDGAPLPVPDPPTDPDANGLAVAVSVGLDGAVFASYLVTVNEPLVGPRLAPVIYRLQNNLWRLAQVKDRYGRFEVVRAERLVVTYKCWLYYYLDPNEANGWKQNLFDPGCNQDDHVSSINDFDLDEDGGVAAGVRRFVYMRDEATDEWLLRNEGLEDVDYLTAAALGQQRAMVTDVDGRIFIHRGRRWCPVASPLNAKWVRAASVPGTNVAYLLAEADDILGTPIARVELRE